MAYMTLQTMAQVEQQRVPHEKPHPHSGYTVIWVQAAAAGWHEVDFVNYPLQPPQIFFLKPMQMHFLQVQEPQGYVLQFSQDQLCAQGISDQYIESLNLFVTLPEPPYLRLSTEDQAPLAEILHALAAELNQPQAYLHEEMVVTQLKLFLLACARIKSQSASPLPLVLEPDQQVVRQFLTLLENSYHRAHKVAFYAENLSLSPDSLNQKLSGLTQKTAKEHIQDRIMLSAKQAAYFSAESAKEVAYRLGFEDPAHFSKFFKNCAGESFSAFRQRVRQKYKT